MKQYDIVVDPIKTIFSQEEINLLEYPVPKLGNTFLINRN